LRDVAQYSEDAAYAHHFGYANRAIYPSRPELPRFSNCAWEPAWSFRKEKDPSSGGFGSEVAQNPQKRFIFVGLLSKMKVRPFGQDVCDSMTTVAQPLQLL
jgi:hypothetical protein